MLRLRLLGGFGVDIDGRPVDDAAWRRRKSRTLVKLLALAPRHTLHRDRIVEELWPHSTPQAGLNSLHQALYAARRAVDSACGEIARGEHHLQLAGEMVVLGPPDEICVDVDEFDRLAAVAEQTGDAGDLRAAIAACHGELLPEDRYEPWSEARRDATKRRHHALVAQLAEHHLDSGRYYDAIAAITPARADDPLDEGLSRVLIRAHLAAGREAEAEAVYRRLVNDLRDELDVAPQPETAQLLDESGTAPGSVRSPNTIPFRPSSFVGRVRELTEMGDALRRTRLLTLTGPGGSGKTRLALELADRCAPSYAGGVNVVEFAPVLDGDGVARALTAALRIPQSPGIAAEQAAATHIASRPGEVLLLLDNCEHLVDAVATLAHALLTSTANATILATSRQPLLVPGEVVWRVPSLSLPAADAVAGPADVDKFEATQLFVERARDADPHFEVTPRNAAAIAMLCARLDGLPLALELAAARLRTMPLADVLARVDDRFALLVGGSRVGLTRQQTLRATVDWSHDLLGADERVLLRRLSVFAGGFTMDAASAVCAGDGISAESIPALVSDLADRSMVTVGQADGTARYGMLETIREYAAEHLRGAGEVASVRDRHAAWTRELAEQAQWELEHTGRRAWLRRLVTETDNLRAALGHLLRSDPAAALVLASLLWRYWFRSARLVEGLQTLSAALSAVPDRTRTRADALLGVCALTNRAGRIGAWEVQAVERLEILTEIGDAHGISRGHYYLGLQAWLVQDLARAAQEFDAAYTVASSADLQADEASARHGLAAVAAMHCRYDEAEAALTEVLEQVRGFDATSSIAVMNVTPLCHRPPGAADHRRVVFEETAAPFTEPAGRLAEGYVLANLGSLARALGSLELAEERYEHALRLFEDEADDVAIGMVLLRLGNLAGVSGEIPRAQAILEAGLRSYRRAGDHRGLYQAAGTLGYWIAAGGDMSRGTAMVARTEAAFRESHDRPGLYFALSHLGALALMADDPRAGMRYYAEDSEIQRDIHASTHLGWSLMNLAEATRRAGDADAARQHVLEAREMFLATARPDGIGACDEVLSTL